MLDNFNQSLSQAVTCLHSGGVIAYPTEGVYGLGCDPFNEQAVMRLLAVKQRPVDKGLILIASDWQQLSRLVKPLPPNRLETIFTTWPGAVTWVFPATSLVPAWIRGNYDTIALRITAHFCAKRLCHSFGNAIVSTSANISNQPACTTYEDVIQKLGQQIDFILPGVIGNLKGPTPIFDGLTGKQIRE